jgi:hypothetical protein
MNLLNTQSLAQTIENLNEAYFNKVEISKTEKISIAKWIASRQGGPRAYANMFAPMPEDWSWGFKLFTGEKITSNAAISYCLGQEACRVLTKLAVKDDHVHSALKNAIEGLAERIKFHNFPKGYYCCAKCTTVYWNYLLTDIDKNAGLLKAGVKMLKERRIGNGKWREFPFWHSLFVLTQLPTEISGSELKYAAASLSCNRILSYDHRLDSITLRRIKIAQKAMQ